ncbi:MAG: AI-2E family transporter [Desulfobacteraceae bacterium]|nr:AI-2E family transporter [Desulfobacteraceae bacterium]MBC2757113.1 AI-2E family transporter [Desulfobacteraceae bacterium]
MINMFRDWFSQRFSDPQIIILWFFLVSGFLFIFLLGKMLTPVFAGLIIAYLLEGVVGTLQKFKIPRNISVFLSFLFFIICFLLLVVGLLPIISQQIGQLISDLPTMISNAQKQLILLPERYPEFISEFQINNMISFLKSELTRLGQAALFFSVASVRSLITVLVYFVLVPFLVLFFLKDKELILDWIKGFLPKNRDLAIAVWNEVNQQISNYVRGKIWEILIVWSASYLTFSVLDLNYAMLLSLFIGLSVLVPYIGATVMFLPVGLIAFFQWGISPDFTKTIFAYAVIQLIDGNILVPLLLSGVVNLHPVAIIVAVLVFGGLWGIWGLFFAIPLATLVHAVIKTWFIKKVIFTKNSESEAMTQPQDTP